MFAIIGWSKRIKTLLSFILSKYIGFEAMNYSVNFNLSNSTEPIIISS